MRDLVCALCLLVGPLVLRSCFLQLPGVFLFRESVIPSFAFSIPTLLSRPDLISVPTHTRWMTLTSFPRMQDAPREKHRRDTAPYLCPCFLLVLSQHGLVVRRTDNCCLLSPPTPSGAAVPLVSHRLLASDPKKCTGNERVHGTTPERRSGDRDPEVAAAHDSRDRTEGGEGAGAGAEVRATAIWSYRRDGCLLSSWFRRSLSLPLCVRAAGFVGVLLILSLFVGLCCDLRIICSVPAYCKFVFRARTNVDHGCRDAPKLVCCQSCACASFGGRLFSEGSAFTRGGSVGHGVG